MEEFLKEAQSDCPDSTIKMLFMFLTMGEDKLQNYMRGLAILKEHRPEVAKEFDFVDVVKNKDIPDKKAEVIAMLHLCSLEEMVEVGAKNQIKMALELLSEHRPLVYESMVDNPN
ncbi:hypothetical protein KJ885_03980 [Patescibacteria group bacterium]|nr:hypothetical protein [Patescibacteria group bacterium]